MRKLLILFLSAAAVMAHAALAQAQVAAPSLSPLPQPGSVPANPAVLSWKPPAVRVAFGLAFQSRELPVTAEYDIGIEGQVDAEWVGDRFAGAWSGGIHTAGLEGTPSQIDQAFNRLQVALRLGSFFSVGAVGERATSTVGLGTSEVHTLPALGATLRVGESFYLGAARGTSSVKDTVGLIEGKQEVDRVGLAYLGEGKTSSWHLELFRETRAELASPFHPLEVSTGVSTETQLGEFTLGYLGITSNASSGGAAFGKFYSSTVTVAGPGTRMGLAAFPVVVVWVAASAVVSIFTFDPRLVIGAVQFAQSSFSSDWGSAMVTKRSALDAAGTSVVQEWEYRWTMATEF